MATKKTERRPAQISNREMRAAIPKIARRIHDLKSFDISSVEKQFSPQVKSLETKLTQLLTDVFGADTIEYHEYNHSVTHIDPRSFNTLYKTPLHEIHAHIKESVDRSLAVLEAIREHFIETLEDAGKIGSLKPIKAYDGLDLHPVIVKSCSQLFKDGHYADAVENAMKALNSLVRLNSGVEDRDGEKLMQYAFGGKSPVLKVNKLADQSDQDEQRGFMYLFSGAVAGLRNPRAHKIIKDDPEMALEFIAFISLLAKFADKAEKVKA